MQLIGQLDFAIAFSSNIAQSFDNTNYIALGRHNDLGSLVKSKARFWILAQISYLRANNF